jgi:hypothetical protein
MADQTTVLFDQLKTAYPDKQWDLVSYQANGEERRAIVFAYVGTSIHDPFSTDCSRFQQPDRYGLSEDHAAQMAQHNVSYEIHVLGMQPDFAHYFDVVKQLAAAQPQALAAEVLKPMGFVAHHTGGHCQTYALFAKDGSHLYITDDSGMVLPETMGEVLIGHYDGNGDTLALYSVTEGK